MAHAASNVSNIEGFWRDCSACLWTHCIVSVRVHVHWRGRSPYHAICCSLAYTLSQADPPPPPFLRSSLHPAMSSSQGQADLEIIPVTMYPGRQTNLEHRWHLVLVLLRWMLMHTRVPSIICRALELRPTRTVESCQEERWDSPDKPFSAYRTLLDIVAWWPLQATVRLDWPLFSPEGLSTSGLIAYWVE
jgi:hypothetical protein